MDLLPTSTVCALVERIVPLSLMHKELCALRYSGDANQNAVSGINQEIRFKIVLLTQTNTEARQATEFTFSPPFGRTVPGNLNPPHVCPAGDFGKHGQASLLPAA